MKKKVALVLFLAMLFFLKGEKYVIDPVHNAVCHNQKGVVNLHDGYYLEAIQEFKLAILLNPNSAASATFYNNLGVTYLKIKKYKWAISCFQKAIDINPNFIEYYQNLVKAHRLNGSLNILLNKNKKLITKNYSNSTAWLMCGLITKENGAKTEALKYLEQYRFMEPDIILSDAVQQSINELKVNY